jgi:hypothetical protein
MIEPKNKFPIQNTQRLCFLKNIITNPNIIIGDYTYYDDPDDVNNFMQNVLYHFDFIGDKLSLSSFPLKIFRVAIFFIMLPTRVFQFDQKVRYQC